MTYAELKSNIANFLNRSDLTNVIDSFIDTFKQEMLREPNKEELINNLISEELKIDENIIENYLNSKNIDVSFSDVFENTL